MRKSSNGKSNDVFYIVYNTKKIRRKTYQKKTKHPKTWISKSALGKGIYLLVYMYMYD